MRIKTALAFGVFAAALALAVPASADVQITMQNGRVSIIAKDATLRQILAEWAKVGQIKILNGERVPGAPLTLQLINVPETQALDTLLRALSGYVASPRAVAVSNLSQFERIAIMPTPAPPIQFGTNAAPPPPTFTQGFPRPPQQFNGDDQEGAPAPVFNQFPPPQVANPGPNNPMQVQPAPGPLVLPPGGNTGAPTYPGGAPAGASTPGMVVQPPQPKKPGGGL